MKKRTANSMVENGFLVDLTVHNVPASLFTEFNERIVKPYFKGNVNSAIQDLIQKALAEQKFVHSHITHLRNCHGYLKVALEQDNDSEVKAEIKKRLKLLEPKGVNQIKCSSSGKHFQSRRIRMFKNNFCEECMKKKFGNQV